MRDDRERLLDILEAITQIEKYAIRGQKAFEEDELIQVWIVHHLQIIGEASSKLSENMRLDNPKVPWVQIIAFRNILVHEYFRVDLKAVWQIITKNITELKKEIENILN